MCETLGVIENLEAHIRAGQIEDFRNLLEQNRGINLNTKLNGFSLLHCAVKENKSYFVKLLIQHGADVNTIDDSNGDTPLHLAVQTNNSALAEILLKSKTNANSKNKHGDTALHVALKRDAYECTRLLLQKNPAGGSIWRVDFDQTNEDGESARNIINNKKEDRMICRVDDMVTKFYATSGGMAGLEGNIYQVLLMILVSIRARKHYTRFQIMPEMEAAGKLDDVVFRYLKDDCWHWRFIQLKHKSSDKAEKNKVGIKDLKQTAKDFQLTKYLGSISKIRKQEEIGQDPLEDFIVCTTATLDESAEFLFQDESSKFQSDPLLYITGTQARLNKLIKEHVPRVVDQQWFAKESITESDIEEICKKTYFITAYPNVNELSKIILDEMGNYFKLNNAILISDFFVQKMTKHILRFRGKPMNETDIDNFIKRIKGLLSIQYCKGLTRQKISKMRSDGVHFKMPFHILGQFLQTDTTEKLLTIKTTCIELSLINVVDALKQKYVKHDDFFIITSENLSQEETRKGIFDAIEHCQRLICILVECQFQWLRDIFAINSNLKLISIEKSDVYQEQDNELCFENLESETQKKIMNKKVIFQGQQKKIKDILNVADVKNAFDCHIILSILRNDQISIASENDGFKKTNCVETYIERVLGKDGNNPYAYVDINILRLTNKRRETSFDHLISLGEVVDRHTDFNIEEKNLVCANHFAAGQIIGVFGEPGVGKTFLLRHLRLKYQSLGCWTILINLNDCALDDKKSHHLSKICFDKKDVGAAVDFLVEVLKQTYEISEANDLITFSLFKFCLLSNTSSTFPRLIILFDGFDEVAPIYEENVFRLIEALKLSKVFTIYITARMHENRKISDRLKSKNYNLTPFSVENQINFVRSHFIPSSHASEESKRISTVRDSNLLRLLSIISEQTMSLDNRCLGLKEQPDNDLPVNFEGSVLKNFRNMTENPLQLKMLLDLCLEPVPLSDMSLNKIYEKFKEQKFSIFFNQKSGIIRTTAFMDTQVDVRSDYESKHCRFACSILLPQSSLDFQVEPKELDRIARVGFIKKQGEQYQFIHRSFAEFFAAEYFMDALSRNQIGLMNKVFLEETFELVCTFLNDKLKETDKISRGSIESKDLSIFFNHNQNGDNVLHVAAERGHTEIIKYLKYILSASRLRVLAKALNEDAETVLDKAAFSAEYDRMFDLFKELLDEKSFLNLLQKSQQYSFRILKTATKTGDYGKMINVFIKLNPEQSAKEHFSYRNENKQTLAHMAASEGTLKAFMKTATEYLDQKALTSMLQSEDGNGMTIIHYGVEVGKLQNILLILKEHLCDKDFTRLVMKSAKDGATVLHFAANFANFAGTTKCLAQNLTKVNFQNLMSMEDSHGRTCLHFAAQRGNCNDLISVIRQFYDDEEIKDFLSTPRSDGATILSIAAYHGHFTNTATILLSYLGQEIFSKLLFQEDNNGWTCLHFCTESGRCNDVITFLRRSYTTTEINNFANEKTNTGLTILHVAAASGTFYTVANIFYNCLGEENFTNLVNIKTPEGWTCLHKGAQLGKAEDVISALRNINFSESKIVEFLSIPTTDGLTLLHIASQSGTFELTMSFLQKTLSKQRLKKLIFQTNQKGYTCLHTAAKVGNCDQVISTIKNHFTESEITEFVYKASNTGLTVLHVLAQGNFLFPVKTLCDCLGKAKVEELIHIKNSQGLTCLHIAAQYGYCKHLIVSLEARFSKADITKFLMSVTAAGLTLLHVAAYGPFRSMVTLLHDYLDQESLEKLIYEKNINGWTCLHLAAEFGKCEEAISSLMEFFSKSEILKMLTTATDAGSTVLHIAACYEYFGQTTLAIIGNFDKETLKSLVLVKDQNGLTSFHYAAKHGVLYDVVSLLDFHFNETERNEILTAPSNNGFTLLHIAASSGHLARTLKVLSECLSKPVLKALMLKTSDAGSTCFHEAAQSGYLVDAISTSKYYFADSELKDILTTTDEDDATLLHIGAFNGHLADTLKSLAESLDEETFKNLVLKVRNDRSTCLHNASKSGRCADAISFIKNYFTLTELTEFLNKSDMRGNTILHYAAFTGQFSTTSKVLVNANGDEEFKNLLFKTNNIGWTCVHYAARAGRCSNVHSFLKRFFSRAELLKFLEKQGLDGETILHVAAYFGHFSDLSKFLFDSFDMEVLQNFVIMKSNNGRTCFHFACKSGKMKSVVCSLKKYFDSSKVKKFLFISDNNGDTILHIASRHGNFGEVSKEVLKNIPLDEFKKLVLQTNNDGSTCLHCSAVSQNCNNIISFLRRNNFDSFQIATILLAPRNNGSIGLHIAACGDNFPTTFNLFTQNFSKDELQTLIKRKDETGSNCFHFAAEYGKFPIVLETLRGQFNLEELYELLATPREDGESVLHIASNCGHFVITAASVVQIFGKEQLRVLMRMRNDEGWTCLRPAFKSRNCIDTILFLKNLFEIDELCEFLCDTGKDCKTLLHIAACSELNQFQEIAKRLQNCMGVSRIHDGILRKDRDGSTCLHIAAASGKCNVVVSFITKHLPKIDLAKFVSEPDNNGKTWAHLAACQQQFPITSALLITALGKETFKKLLYKKDQNGCTCLYYGGLSNNQVLIIDFLKKHLTKAEISKLERMSSQTNRDALCSTECTVS